MKIILNTIIGFWLTIMFIGLFMSWIKFINEPKRDVFTELEQESKELLNEKKKQWELKK